MRILVADDEIGKRNCAPDDLVSRLIKIGHDVTGVSTSSEALDLIRREKWDIAFLDLRWKNEEKLYPNEWQAIGWKLVQSVRSSVKNKNTQAIIWSGFIDRDIENRAIQQKIIAIAKIKPYVSNNPIASGHISSLLTLVRTLEWLREQSCNNVFSPETYNKLASYITNLFNETRYSDYEKNVFIMTSFEKNPKLEEITQLIRDTLSARGLEGLSADDHRFANILWDNVCTYIFGCKYGIAVLENFSRNEFNPNVALEYGYMIALGKETLLLKKKQFKTRADILGTIYHEFDKDSLATTIPTAINNWLDSLGLP